MAIQRSIRTLLIGVMLAMLASSASAQDAQGLLAKNRAFAGWVLGDASMSGLRLSGTFGPYQITDIRRGVQWRREQKSSSTGLSDGFGFTGQRWWYSNANGFVVPILGDGAKYQVSLAFAMSQGLPLLNGTLRGASTVEGTPTQTIRLDVPNGFPLDAYLEPSSGKLLRAVIDPDGEKSTIDIVGYSALEGKQVISKWRIGSRIAEYDKLERTSIADDGLRPPKPGAAWTFGAPVAVPIAVTPTRIYLEAVVNGAKGRFALDTGADGIYLNADFAERARLKTLAPLASYGINGETHTSLSRADSIQIGPHILRNAVVLTGVAVQGETENFDGLFGFDFLAGAIVDVDLTKKTMTLFDPDRAEVTANGPVVVADLSGGSPRIPVTFDGRIKAHLTLDTGDPMTVVASNDLYGGSKVTMRVEFTTNLAGAGGTSRDLATCGHVQGIELGPIKYGNVPTCFTSNAKLFGSDGGIIGLDFIKHFNLTFDYPNSRLYLTPNGK